MTIASTKIAAVPITSTFALQVTEKSSFTRFPVIRTTFYVHYFAATTLTNDSTDETSDTSPSLADTTSTSERPETAAETQITSRKPPITTTTTTQKRITFKIPNKPIILTEPPFKIIEITTKTTQKTTTKQNNISYVKAEDEWNDLSNDIEEIPYTKKNVEIETPVLPINQHDVVKNTNEVTHQKIIVDNQRQEENGVKTTVFVVGVVFGVLFGLVGMTLAVKKYHLFHCLRGINYSSNTDNRSDVVAFATNAEELNLDLSYESI